ncbi:MAG: DUF3846 domain-containing protein [Clostridia bacterium]|nr:DUF3846 domain-containing protein [Clostridia bacterium]
MEEHYLKILVKDPGKNPEVKKIRKQLKSMQDIVGGYIEIVPYKEAIIVCNEEGKLNNLEPNVNLDKDYIAGSFFIVGDDEKNGDFKSLTDEQIERFKKEFSINLEDEMEM